MPHTAPTAAAPYVSGVRWSGLSGDKPWAQTPEGLGVTPEQFAAGRAFEEARRVDYERRLAAFQAREARKSGEAA